MNREKVFKKFKGKCAYCGCSIDINNFHIEHIIPKKNGGTDKFDNLLPACCDCNLSKGSLDIESFRKKIENLIITKHHGRLIKNYYGVKRKKIRFYFEK